MTTSQDHLEIPDLTLGATWPPLETFRALAADRRVIPVVRRFLADGETPIGVYRKLARDERGVAGRLAQAEQRLEHREDAGALREARGELAAGRDNRSIAATMGVGERAIKAHVSSLLALFGLDNRTELALLAVKELQERIVVLQEEIGRLEAAIASKQASRNVADQFFKK